MELMKFIETLNFLRPNSLWSLNGDTYDGLIWLDPTQTKPTEEEINSAIDVVALSNGKIQKNQQIYEFFRAKKITLISIKIGGVSYSFTKTETSHAQWASKLTSIGKDSPYIWEVSTTGPVKLRKDDLNNLLTQAMAIDNQMDILYSINASSVNSLSSIEELNNYTITETLPLKYS